MSLRLKSPPPIRLHPILVVLALMLMAVGLTHAIPAGKFRHVDRRFVSGSYQRLSKVDGLSAVFAPTAPAPTSSPARAAGVVALFTAIPAGMTRSASLIFMVMFVGGTFGVLRATGAVDAGVDRLLYLTSGNVYLLAAGLLLLLASGSTFLGFSSEYVAIIPLVLVLGQRLGLPNLFAPAIVALADLLGYAASVTNPIALGVAQPLAGVRVFSGLMPRFGIFIVLVGAGMAYVFSYLRRQPAVKHDPEATKLSLRQSAVLLSLVLGGAFLVLGTSLWTWGTTEHAAAFLGLATVIALVGGTHPQQAADAFLEGAKVMVLPCLLIGFGSAVGIILEDSQVMDSIVQGISQMIHGNGPGVVAVGLMCAEMCFSVLIPSVSAKAAVSVPALTPIALLSHVNGQTTVTALLLGSGMTNMISPTNPLLLAFLAASKVDYSEWARFIAPLFVALTLFSAVVLFLMASVSA